MRKNEDRAEAGKEARFLPVKGVQDAFSKPRAEAGEKVAWFYSEEVCNNIELLYKEGDFLPNLLADLMHAYGDEAVLASADTAREYYEVEKAEQ